jgi:hypothetical protein
MPRRDDGVEFMRDGPRPKIQRIFTFASGGPSASGNIVGHTLSFTRSGGRNVGPIKRWDGMPRMQTNLEAQVT